MPVYAFSVPLVTFQHEFLYTTGEVEDFEVSVIRCCHELGIGRRKGQISDGVVVRLY